MSEPPDYQEILANRAAMRASGDACWYALTHGLDGHGFPLRFVRVTDELERGHVLRVVLAIERGEVAP